MRVGSEWGPPRSSRRLEKAGWRTAPERPLPKDVADDASNAGILDLLHELLALAELLLLALWLGRDDAAEEPLLLLGRRGLGPAGTTGAAEFPCGEAVFRGRAHCIVSAAVRCAITAGLCTAASEKDCTTGSRSSSENESERTMGPFVEDRRRFSVQGGGGYNSELAKPPTHTQALRGVVC